MIYLVLFPELPDLEPIQIRAHTERAAVYKTRRYVQNRKRHHPTYATITRFIVGFPFMTIEALRNLEPYPLKGRIYARNPSRW